MNKRTAGQGHDIYIYMVPPQMSTFIYIYVCIVNSMLIPNLGFINSILILITKASR